MSRIRCPVCDLKNSPDTVRCTACGADWDDPDVRAMAEGGAAALPAASLRDAGALSSDRFLGFSIERLAAGPGFRKLGLLGALLLAGGFLLPVTLDFRELAFAWTALGEGPAFALLYPAAAALIGIAVALLPGLPTAACGTLLAAAGLAGLLLCVPKLGALAGTPEKASPLLLLGLTLGGSAAVLRVIDPREGESRYLLVAAGVLVALGLFLPTGDPWHFLPLELRFFASAEEGDRLSPLAVVLEVFNRDPVVLLSSLYLLLPLALLPAATFFAWPRPGGPWDQSGLALRPVAWVLVLYLPLGLVLFSINMMGWNLRGLVFVEGKVITFDEFTRTALYGRVRLAGIAAAFALWSQLGAVALYRHLRGSR